MADEHVNNAIKHSGKFFVEEGVVVILECVPAVCLGALVDIDIIRKYFDADDGVFEERKKMIWYCFTCHEAFADRDGIGYDSCLNW